MTHLTGRMDGSPQVLSGTLAGRYTVERELGRGATATVYLARDAQRETHVAVKVLRPELSASVGADRFQKEIELNSKLHHPHIVPVLDSGEHQGQLYFVLPHMEGGSLRHLLRRDKQLPVETAVQIACTVAEALDYAHNEGLIHRDVKPENILFTSGQACLADFGIARAIERAIDESTTSTGLVRGTPAYMSPEQAGGNKQYDGRSDQFSLACVLYEMLAGVQAFIGATPEAIIAQRFQHAPRPVRVYRPSVSQGLEAVLEKAFSQAAADRFQSMGAFMTAVRDAPRQPTQESRTVRAPWWSGPRGVAAASGALAVALLGYFAVGGFAGSDSRLDTTRYVLLPVEGDSTLPASETYDHLHQAFQRWSGISVASRFEMRDALGSGPATITDASAARVARRLGAGRYVRTRLSRSGSVHSLSATLFATATDSSLSNANVALAASLPSVEGFDEVASRLLLRGRKSVARSRVLPAVQLYERAGEARTALDLRGAEALLLGALELDTNFSQAALMLAQVRAWNGQSAQNWKAWAARAATDAVLGPADVELGRALVTLAAGDAPTACRAMERIALGNPNDFAGWYSLGNCLKLDTAVVRDSRSPSGWRFRSSYHRAVRAYLRAFELAPALHRSFQAGAYRELRLLLYAGSGVVRPGLAVPPDTGRFLAYPSWRGDSLLFVPYPRALVTSNQVRTDPAAWSRAIVKQRELFARVSRAWAVALPNNAGTKEAVAIAMDMLGDAAAVDTMRAARKLASDSVQRRRLATEEVMLRVATGRGDPEKLRGAIMLADSLLHDAPGARGELASALVPLAALRGRCRLAGHLSASVTSRTDVGAASDLGLPFSVYAAAESLTTFSHVACRASSDTSGLVAIEDAIRQSGRDAAGQAQLRGMLLTRIFRVSPGGPATLRASTIQGGDYLLRAQSLAQSGNTTEARRILEERRLRRGPSGTSEVSPDAVLAEALTWIAIGDSVEAARWLDPLLNRPSWLEPLFGNAAAAGALVQASVLRAQLAFAANDLRTADKWSAFASALWQDGDPEVRALLQRIGASRVRKD